MQSRETLIYKWRTIGALPKSEARNAYIYIYISGAPPGAPFQLISFSSLQWRRTAPELPGQASLSDSMTRLSDGMVVQARLHLNQGMGTFLLLLEINLHVAFSFVFVMFCLYSWWFSLRLSLVLLVVISFDVLDPLGVLTGSDGNVNALVNISHYTPSKAKSHVDLPQN